jgi:tRNA threonylcarbamoyl adenosine modification protein YjeE
MRHGTRLLLETLEEMLALGQRLGAILFDGAVIGLSGPLGAGKTTLARGIADGMRIDDGYVVSSPTYTIMQSYPCLERELHHMDLYRITSSDDLDSTGYRDHVGGNAVLIVEWPEREPSVLTSEHLIVLIDYKDEGREVTFVPSGGLYEKLAKRVVDVFSLNRSTRRHGDTED